MFANIHHRKANEIRGKWEESIMMVASKIVNFVKDGFTYGVFVLDSTNFKMNGAKNTSLVNFGLIINRVYLDYYKNQEDFWKELGKTIQDFSGMIRNNDSDHWKIIRTIK